MHSFNSEQEQKVKAQLGEPTHKVTYNAVLRIIQAELRATLDSYFDGTYICYIDPEDGSFCAHKVSEELLPSEEGDLFECDRLTDEGEEQTITIMVEEFDMGDTVTIEVDDDE